MSTKKLALTSVFCGSALLMFVLESLFPSFLLPGAKMGLSNIFTLLTIVLVGGWQAILLVIVRTTLGCLIVGNMSALMYSLSAGLVSAVISVVLYRYLGKKLSIVSISVAGSVVHNIVQAVVFMLVTSTVEYLAFLGYLAIFGVLSGLVVGFCVVLIIRKIPKGILDKIDKNSIRSIKSES